VIWAIKLAQYFDALLDKFNNLPITNGRSSLYELIFLDYISKKLPAAALIR